MWRPYVCMSIIRYLYCCTHTHTQAFTCLNVFHMCVCVCDQNVYRPRAVTRRVCFETGPRETPRKYQTRCAHKHHFTNKRHSFYTRHRSETFRLSVCPSVRLSAGVPLARSLSPHKTHSLFPHRPAYYDAAYAYCPRVCCARFLGNRKFSETRYETRGARARARRQKR